LTYTGTRAAEALVVVLSTTLSSGPSTSKVMLNFCDLAHQTRAKFLYRAHQ